MCIVGAGFGGLSAALHLAKLGRHVTLLEGDASRLADLPWIPFPGGRRFRAPYSTVGSWWYALRDKIGV